MARRGRKGGGLPIKLRGGAAKGRHHGGGSYSAAPAPTKLSKHHRKLGSGRS